MGGVGGGCAFISNFSSKINVGIIHNLISITYAISIAYAVGYDISYAVDYAFHSTVANYILKLAALVYFRKVFFFSDGILLYRGFSLLQSNHPLFLPFSGLFFKIYFIKVEAF